MKSTNLFIAATAALSFVGVATLAHAQTLQPESGRPATKTQPQTQPTGQAPSQMQTETKPGMKLQPESGRPATKIPPLTQPQSQMQTGDGSAKAATPDSTQRPDYDRATADRTNMDGSNTDRSTTGRSSMDRSSTDMQNNSTNNSTYNRPNTGADGMNRADRAGNTGMDNSTANESTDRRNMRTQRDSNSGFTERAPRADRN